MNIRYLGAILVLCACGGFGFSVAASCRREIHLLRQLIRTADLMKQELDYRLTPLPELCFRVGKCCNGVLLKILHGLTVELNDQVLPDAASCMRSVLSKTENLPRSVQRILAELGTTLGQYDLSGQIQGLEQVKQHCAWYLNKLEQNQHTRLRSYQTLGLCAGAALVILFI